jgi:hypothetical protein
MHDQIMTGLTVRNLNNCTVATASTVAGPACLYCHVCNDTTLLQYSTVQYYRTPVPPCSGSSRRVHPNRHHDHEKEGREREEG